MRAPLPVTAKPIPEALPATLRPLGALPAEEAHDRFWNLAALMATCLVAVGVGGVWAYAKVRASLQDVRAAGLVTLLEAEVGGVLTWIDEKKRDAERWASTPAVQAAAAAAATQPGEGGGCAPAARQALVREIAPYMALQEAAAFNLVDRAGTILASSDAVYCGRRIASAEFMGRMAPVFAGRTVFIRPFDEAERVAEAAGTRTAPLVWVETPVRDERGEVIAALGFGRPAAARFGRLLMLSSAETTREAYAFDRHGRMLTQSRFVGDLRAAGLVGANDDGVLSLEVRDPGADVAQGGKPLPAARREPTRLAQAAIAAHGAPEGGEGGAVLEPYRNYRGALVIGAFRWVPEKDMAIAVEIEASEAYAPLEYVQIAFGSLFAFLLVSLGAAGATSLWAMRLRLREARRIGPYELERELGEGGMSRVYLARHALLKRPTAVKVLKTAVASDEVMTRFVREVQLSSRLAHPNTVEIYDYGRTREGGLYYAMEYLRGVTLEELVRREGPMPLARALHVLRQACDSLGDAHAEGLVHRDVKPSNLMVCVRGARLDVVKVLDFGLVKEMRNPHTRDITQFAKVLGTPLYMSPERIRNPADADARADIYALGSVAFFLLTGRPVFAAETDHDLVNRILHAPPPRLAEAAPGDWPPALEDLLARCLAKDREARPATMAEVEAALAALAAAHPWTVEEARAWWRERGPGFGIALD